MIQAGVAIPMDERSEGGQQSSDQAGRHHRHVGIRRESGTDRLERSFGLDVAD